MGGTSLRTVLVDQRLQALLGQLPLEHLFLDAAAGQEAVHKHALLLAIAPHLQEQGRSASVQTAA